MYYLIFLYTTQSRWKNKTFNFQIEKVTGVTFKIHVFAFEYCFYKCNFEYQFFKQKEKKNHIAYVLFHISIYNSEHMEE